MQSVKKKKKNGVEPESTADKRIRNARDARGAGPDGLLSLGTKWGNSSSEVYKALTWCLSGFEFGQLTIYSVVFMPCFIICPQYISSRQELTV